MVVLLVGSFAGCTNHEPDFIQQPSTPKLTTLSTDQLRQWYQKQGGTLAASKQDSASSVTAGAETETLLKWEALTTKSIGSERVSLIPFNDVSNPFAGTGYFARRHLLVVQKAGRDPKAAIIEVLAAKSHDVAQSQEVFFALYRQGKSRQKLPEQDFTGFVFYYTLRYEHVTGRAYVTGQVVPGNPRLAYTGTSSKGRVAGASAKPTACIYIVISHDPPYTVNVCDDSSGGPTGGTFGGGGSEGGGPGGGIKPADFPELPEEEDTGGNNGGSSIPMLNPNVVLLTPPPGQVIPSVREYVKCFTQDQGALLSIYVDQPKPNTRDTWSGPFNDPDVGHTFISIQQGGTIRTLGFYPRNGTKPLEPEGPSALVDNSGHIYDVKMDINISANQLANLLNYIKNYPSLYNLNSYNCTNFGIGAAHAAGTSLPSTMGGWVLGSGCNPGDLGQDIRGITSTPTVRTSTNQGNAKSNAGGC